VREADLPATGSEVGVAVDESAVLVFAAENGAETPTPTPTH
jgi:hypothetical protein